MQPWCQGVVVVYQYFTEKYKLEGRWLVVGTCLKKFSNGTVQ